MSEPRRAPPDWMYCDELLDLPEEDFERALEECEKYAHNAELHALAVKMFKRHGSYRLGKLGFDLKLESGIEPSRTFLQAWDGAVER